MKKCQQPVYLFLFLTAYNKAIKTNKQLLKEREECVMTEAIIDIFVMLGKCAIDVCAEALKKAASESESND